MDKVKIETLDGEVFIGILLGYSGTMAIIQTKDNRKVKGYIVDWFKSEV